MSATASSNMRSSLTEPKERSSSFFSSFRRRINSTTVAPNKRKTAAPPLQRLLKKTSFETICKCLEDPAISTDAWFKHDYSMIGESCLHILMRHRPPAIVVQLMLDQYRTFKGADEQPEHSVDLLGRTPLHVAVAYLCTPDVIEVLLSTTSGRQAITALDMQHRLPLHLAALASNELLDLVQAKRKVPVKSIASLSMEEIRSISQTNTELLMEVWPEALLARDNLGVTPMQYTAETASTTKNDELIMLMKSKAEDIRIDDDEDPAPVCGRTALSMEIPMGILLLDDNGSISTISMSAVRAEEKWVASQFSQ